MNLGPPFLYSNGSIQDLDPSLLSHSGHSSGANAINDNGEIVGADGIGNAFTYSNGSAQLIGPGTAYGVNSSGEVVGTSGGHGFVSTSSGTPQDLNTLIAPGSGWTISSANAINGSGQIAGTATNTGGQVHAVLLTPTSIVSQETNKTPASPLTTLPAPGSLEVLDKATGEFVPYSSTSGTIGYIDPKQTTVVLTHGFSSSPSIWAGSDGFAENLADAEPMANIIAWNWMLLPVQFLIL